MARGYPDYFGVSTFPRYGAFTSTEGNLIFNALIPSASLFDIIAKGQIYGGVIWFTAAADVTHVAIEAVIDGNSSQRLNLKARREYNFTEAYLDPFYLTCYNIESHVHCLGISSKITFDTSIKVNIYNIPLVAFWVNGFLLYSIVKE